MSADPKPTGMEREPDSLEEVLDAADDVELLQRHSAPVPDGTGMNPTRRQDTGPPASHDDE